MHISYICKCFFQFHVILSYIFLVAMWRLERRCCLMNVIWLLLNLLHSIKITASPLHIFISFFFICYLSLLSYMTFNPYPILLPSLVQKSWLGLIYSGGWDSALKLWDVKDMSCTRSIDLPAKVYSMSLAKNMLTVAMADRFVYVFDTRKMNEPFQRRESALKFQTRCIRNFPNGEGRCISLSSVICTLLDVILLFYILYSVYLAFILTSIYICC